MTLPHRYKVVVIGDSGVGKSSLTSRFTRNTFSPQFHSTVGVELASRALAIDGQTMEAQVWDTPGKERYRGVMGAYYGGAHGVVLVYDSTKAQTFENLEGWIRDLKEHNVKDAVMMIVGNKCDLSQLRAVPTDEARAFANAHKMSFMETSALDGTSVDLAFQILLTEIFYNGKSQQSQPQQPIPVAATTPYGAQHQHQQQQQQQQQQPQPPQQQHGNFNNNNFNNSNSNNHMQYGAARASPGLAVMGRPPPSPVGIFGGGGGGGGVSGTGAGSRNFNHELNSAASASVPHPAPMFGQSPIPAASSATSSNPLVASYLQWEEERRRQITDLNHGVQALEVTVTQLHQHRVNAQHDATTKAVLLAQCEDEVRALTEQLHAKQAEAKQRARDKESKDRELEDVNQRCLARERELANMRSQLANMRAEVDDGLNLLVTRAQTFRQEARIQSSDNDQSRF